MLFAVGPWERVAKGHHGKGHGRWRPMGLQGQGVDGTSMRSWIVHLHECWNSKILQNFRKNVDRGTQKQSMTSRLKRSVN